MPLQGNGQLLVKVRGQPFTALVGPAPRVVLSGYALEPLSPAPQARAGFVATAPADHWLLARPTVPAPAPDTMPWQRAHAVAQASGYAHYIEPDILHVRPVPPLGKLDGGLKEDWPPTPADKVSPGWHLSSDFTGFAVVRARATGTGVRIAHLDTGYTPQHCSTPRNMLPKFGYDYWDNRPSTVDPGTSLPGDMPGHGTATLALLSGNAVDLQFGGERYSGDFGGAPDAEVVPVRISPSVIHLYTSTMAKGLYHALAPLGDSAMRCDVVTISHGGLPCATWADAVNMLYEDGIVIVAASGDSISLTLVDIATRYTVYPSAFNRVLTALGATYSRQPYITDKFNVMQGCWGPNSVMMKAIAAFTPNVAWMTYNDLPCGFSMDGAGTSSSTPQIAAACALWLQCFGKRLPMDWRRVEACRLAAFDSADNRHPDQPKLGWGLLRVPEMLDPQLADRVIAKVTGNSISAAPADDVSFPFWRLLAGVGPPRSEQDRMYETEVAQVVLQSTNVDLLRAVREAAAPGATFSPAERVRLASALSAEAISHALRTRLVQSVPALSP